MFPEHNAVIRQTVAEAGLVSVEMLDELATEQAISGKSLAEALTGAGLLRLEELLRLVARHLDVEAVWPTPSGIPMEMARHIPAGLARQYGTVPWRSNGRRLEVLAIDPLNPHVEADLSMALNREVRVAVADPEAVEKLLKALYGEEDNPLENLLRELDGQAEERPEAEAAREWSDTELTAQAGQAPIIRFVNLVLAQAIRDRASDIHFEPFEREFHIRYRIDGSLYEMSPPPRHLAVPVISRLKVLADLNIAERRTPQDGRIQITLEGRPVDLRVSTLPTQFGESVVLRVLDKGVVNLNLDQLSMPADILRRVREIVRRPNGIFIVTGPTGSGKTTTLYSALREINETGTKILTVEDPVEYEIDGVMQVGVNPNVKLTFAHALRSFLRQDPDVIMVGEIRDLETARIAVQASLTGHLVLSTLHTNDAPGAVTRLMDMGLEPYLLAATLECVLAQRLLRRICSSCRRSHRPRGEMLAALGLTVQEAGGKLFHHGAGCPACHGTGYRGRQGLFEMFAASEQVREAIGRQTAAHELKSLAMAAGMRTLREDGLRAIYEGLTTVEEVIRYT